MVTNAVTLDNNATFNITAYKFSYDTDVPGFGETMDFKLNPNLAGPANVPKGSIVTEHWLQLINANQKYNGFGYTITGQQGFWKLDNGGKTGGEAAGPDTGPYYDSNLPMGLMSSVPPTFHDFPKYYTGVGTYLHFFAIPTWDVFTPVSGMTPASDSIDVGNYAVEWGFTIVPEPSSIVLISIGSASISVLLLLKRKTKQPATERE